MQSLRKKSPHRDPIVLRTVGWTRYTEQIRVLWRSMIVSARECHLAAFRKRSSSVALHSLLTCGVISRVGSTVSLIPSELSNEEFGDTFGQRGATRKDLNLQYSQITKGLKLMLLSRNLQAPSCVRIRVMAEARFPFVSDPRLFRSAPKDGSRQPHLSPYLPEICEDPVSIRKWDIRK